MTRRWRSLAAAAAAAAVTLLGAGAATAAPAHHGPPHGVRYLGHTKLIHRAAFTIPATHLPRLHPGGHAPRNVTAVRSTNWSGWADQACSTCTLRYVNVNFTAPAINCAGVTTSGDTYVSEWSGLDGLFTQTVEQTGVGAFCDTTTPVYYTWYEMYPQLPVVFTITGFGPGDAVNANVYYNSATRQYQLTLHDLTQNVGFTTSQPCAATACANKSAEVITEDPGGAAAAGIRLANFGQAYYQNATVTSRNGTHGNLGDEPRWNAYQVFMYNGGTQMAAPGPLANNGASSAFRDTWRNGS
jgi:hypothetical protein